MFAATRTRSGHSLHHQLADKRCRSCAATATAITGGNVTLTWPTQSGINYSVQWSDDLVHWTDIFLGTTGTWTDVTAASATRRFYRVSR